MPDRIDAFVAAVGAEIRWKKARSPLTEEIRTHLLDQRDACLAQGMSQTEAEAESLRQMGDPVEVGTQLDRVHRPAPQWGMLALVGLLLCSGFFIQATVMQQLGRVQPYMPTVIVSILLGVAAMAAVYLGDYTLLGRRPVLLYSLGMAALAVLIQRGGMRVGGISYTLLGPVLYALLVYGLRGKGWRGLLLALAGLVPPVVLPCLIPNFTSGAIAGLSGAAVVLTAAWKGWMGVPRKKGAAAVAVGLLVLNGAALWHLSQSPYALERVRFALHPELDPLGLGYFPMMVREMLSGAQWLGKGELGELSGAAGYLPGVSDYWLARVIHELGWAAGLALLALMTALFALGLRRCMRQRGMLGRLLSTAALTTLVLETVCFVVYDLGFPLAAPLVLPFLSTGGRYMVVNLLLLGLMLSAFREERLPQGQKGPAAQSSRGRPLISWRDGDLVIALGRRTGK